MTRRTSTIKTKIDGVEVEGLLTRYSANDFSLSITKPFTGRTGGSHVPLFLMGHGRFTGDYSEKRTLEVLRELYEQGEPTS